MIAAELTGRVVMVHPELHDDPAAKNGEIGCIIAADLSENTILVKFDDDRLGFYASNALLEFKPTEQLYFHLKQNAMQLDSSTFRDLKSIALLLDYGTLGGQVTAMEIAQKNLAVLSYALASLEEHPVLHQTSKRGR